MAYYKSPASTFLHFTTINDGKKTQRHLRHTSKKTTKERCYDILFMSSLCCVTVVFELCLMRVVKDCAEVEMEAASASYWAVRMRRP